MDDTTLRDAWAEAWREFGVTPDEKLRAELLTRYSEPHRAYHTLQHLGECLALLARERDTAERPAEVAVALWFHDAIYDIGRHDNEERSADWARRAMVAAGAAPGAAERVHALVMATRHDAQPVGADARLLVDIDLAILGADTARFAEYETRIRREYAHVPAPAAPGEARCWRRFSPAIRSTARRGCATPSRRARGRTSRWPSPKTSG